MNYIRWEKNSEVVNNVYSKYIRRLRYQNYAKFKEIIQDIETKWHYLVSVKVECVKPLPDPLTLILRKRGRNQRF